MNHLIIEYRIGQLISMFMKKYILLSSSTAIIVYLKVIIQLYMFGIYISTEKATNNVKEIQNT